MTRQSRRASTLRDLADSLADGDSGATRPAAARVTNGTSETAMIAAMARTAGSSVNAGETCGPTPSHIAIPTTRHADEIHRALEDEERHRAASDFPHLHPTPEQRPGTKG